MIVLYVPWSSFWYNSLSLVIPNNKWCLNRRIAPILYETGGLADNARIKAEWALSSFFRAFVTKNAKKITNCYDFFAPVTLNSDFENVCYAFTHAARRFLLHLDASVTIIS